MQARSLLYSTASRPALSVSSRCEFASSTATTTVSTADLPTRSGSVHSPMMVKFSTGTLGTRRIAVRSHAAVWPESRAAIASPAPAPADPPPLPAADVAEPEEQPAVPVRSEKARPAAEPVAPPPQEPAAAAGDALQSAEPAAAAVPSQEAPSVAAPPQPEPAAASGAEPEKPSQKIELIIDSLQGFELGKPIPVHVERLADKKFKATVPESDITTTGPTMGEAFVLLKDQIERNYAKYVNQKSLEPDQQRQLDLLQKYILKERRRSSWGFR